MKNYILFLITFASMLFTGCSESETHPEYSYVETYMLADTIYAYQLQGNYTHIVAIRFDGKKINMAPTTLEQFKSLAKLYNDISFTGTTIPNKNKALSSAVESISIICNQDFDAEHTAGQPLDNIFKLFAGSPYGFIKSGYKDYTPLNAFPDYWIDMTRLQSEGYKPLELPLNAVNVDNTKMLYPICYLHFTKTPVNKGTYTFTIKMKVGEKEINSKFNATF